MRSEEPEPSGEKRNNNVVGVVTKAPISATSLMDRQEIGSRKQAANPDLDPSSQTQPGPEQLRKHLERLEHQASVRKLFFMYWLQMRWRSPDGWTDGHKRNRRSGQSGRDYGR